MTLDKKTVAASARRWWKALQPSSDGKWRGDRAALARLRRASDPWTAATEPATLDLFRAFDLVDDGAPDERKAEALSRVAAIASVLAHVKTDATARVARAAGPPRNSSDGEGAVLTRLRLARLMSARGDEEIATSFRRLVAQLDAANVGDLAWLMLVWDRDELGDRTRTLFAFDYHDAADHAPPDPDAPSPSSPNANH